MLSELRTRATLAIHVLRGRPLAYRLNFRNGALVFGGRGPAIVHGCHWEGFTAIGTTGGGGGGGLGSLWDACPDPTTARKAP